MSQEMKDQDSIIQSQQTCNQSQKRGNNEGNELIKKYEDFYSQMHRDIVKQQAKTYFVVSNNFIKKWKEYHQSEKYSPTSKKPTIEDDIFNQGTLIPKLKYKTHFEILNLEIYTLLQPFVNPQNKNQRSVKWQQDPSTNQIKPHFIIQCNYIVLNSLTLRKIDCGYIKADQFQYKTIFLKENTPLDAMIDQFINPPNLANKIFSIKSWHLNQQTQVSKIYSFILKQLVGLCFQDYQILNIGKKLGNSHILLSDLALTNPKLYLLFQQIQINGSKPIFIQNFDGYCKGCELGKPQPLHVQCPCRQIRYCSENCLKKHLNAHQPKCSYAEEIQLNKQIVMLENPQSVKGQAGLMNLGNTCYMNSCLQCLSNTLPLTKYFLKGHFQKEINKKNPMGTKGKLTKTYAKFIRAIWCEKETVFSPNNLKDLIGKINPNFSGYGQQDAQQFFSFLVDGLHEDLSRLYTKLKIQIEEELSIPESELAKTSWKSFLGRNQSIMTDLMTGQYRSSLKCPDCNRKSMKFETFNTLTLPIPIESLVRFFMIPQYQSGKSIKGYFKYKSHNVNEWIKNACEAVEKKNPERYVLYVVTEKENIYRVGREPMEEIINRIENENKNLFLIEMTDQEMKIPKDQVLELTINMTQPGNKDKQQLYFKFPMFFNKKNASQYEISKRILKFIYNRTYTQKVGKQVTSEEDQKYQAYEATMVKKRIFSVYLKFNKKTNLTHRKIEVLFESEIQLQKKTLVVDILTKENVPVSQCEIEIRFLSPENTNEFNFHKMKRYEELGNAPKMSKDPIIPLEDCFEAFSQPQVLLGGNQWYCPHCKQRKRAIKQMKIERAPQILVIQLKRFRQKGSRKQKIRLLVDFPFDLNLQKYVQDQRPIQAYREEIRDIYVNLNQKIVEDIGMDITSRAKYQLYAVINHFGDLGGGHYTAYAKNNGIWMNYNDSSFQPISSQNVKTKQAFLLFYQRKIHQKQ